MSPPDDARSSSPGRTFPGWVVLVAFLPGLLNLLPHLGGAAAADPPREVYLGYRYQPGDFANYMAIVRYARETGSLATPNLYVTDPQQGRFVLPYFWAVGQLAGAAELDEPEAWHLFGLFASWAFFLVAWRLACALLAGPRARRVAFLLICFGGGVEWALFGLQAGLLPGLELQAEELRYYWNWSSFGATQIPMWTGAYFLFGLALLAALRVARSGAATPARVAGGALAIFASFLVHPYTGLAALAVLGAYALVPWIAGAWHTTTPARAAVAPYLKVLLLVVGGAALIGGLNLWAAQDPVYAKTSSQAARWTPHYDLWWYPLLYGVPLVLALFGVKRRVAARDADVAASRLLITWLGVTVMLSMAPFLAAVKFQFLVHLPLSLLAADGLEYLVDRSPRVGRWVATRGAATLFWLVVGLGPALTLVRGFPDEAGWPTHVQQPHLDLLAALDGLAEGPVLTSYEGGTLVPWKSGDAVFLGHWFSSYDFETRQRAVQGFFRPGGDAAKKARLLALARVRYVVEDPWTARGDGAVDPRLGLKLRYENGFGRIWEVPADLR